MSKLKLLSRIATMFNKSGGIDEAAQRQYLQMFVDANIGVYLGSSGSGEGHALSRDELRQLYRIGVDVCKGKVPVYGNPPEQFTARDTLEHINIALECGVEMVNVYGPDGRHGYKPTDAEFLHHIDLIASELAGPIAIAPNPILGYTPRPALTAAACAKHPQIAAINLAGLDERYFLELKPLLTRELQIYAPLKGAPISLSLGAAGLIGGDFNIVPKTFRKFLDLYEQKDFVEMAKVYDDLMRFINYCAKWNASTPRWIKMTLKVLKLPGGEGGVRQPYLIPDEAELKVFADGLLRLRVPEIEQHARAAGLAIPA